jgi:hypothetical protein
MASMTLQKRIHSLNNLKEDRILLGALIRSPQLLMVLFSAVPNLILIPSRLAASVRAVRGFRNVARALFCNESDFSIYAGSKV